MNVLILCGDHWHSPQIARRGLGALSRTEFTFDWIEDTRDWSPETILKYPVVILARSDNISATVQTAWRLSVIQAAFLEYVRKENGLLAIHSGAAEYAEKPVLRGLLGGVFDHHPEPCPVTVTAHPGHTLSAGSASFTVEDEPYFMAVDDREIDVFVTTSSRHGEQPGGWRRFEERGRVAVLTPGHNLEVWLHPSFQTLVRNCLNWCSSALPADG